MRPIQTDYQESPPVVRFINILIILKISKIPGFNLIQQRDQTYSGSKPSMKVKRAASRNLPSGFRRSNPTP